MNLKELRVNIDKLDNEIVKLINQRCELAVKVGEWKTQNDIPFYVPEREKELFERLSEKNNGPINNKALNFIYREIISAAIALEKPLKIAFLNSPSFPCASEVSRKTFGNSAQFHSQTSIAALFSSLNRKFVDYIVIPIYDKNFRFLDEIVADIPVTAKICAESKDDRDQNSSVFLIFGHQEPEPCSFDQSILLAETGDKDNVLQIAKSNNIKILNIETFNKNNKENIFIELVGHINNNNAIYSFINELSKKNRVHNLGSFTVLN